MNKVLIEQAGYQDCTAAIEKVFETFPLDLAGKSVLINPNALRFSSPEQCITTHPAVLGAVVQKVKSMNPLKIIVGDNVGVTSYGANEKTFKECGMFDAAAGYYENIGIDGVDREINAGKYATIKISKAVVEADVVISVPKFKSHGLTIMSGAIKNCFGYVLGAQKAGLHVESGNPERFGEFLVDIFKLRVPDLFIMDAIVGMEGNGPASTELRYIGKILASDNAVAMDSIVTRMMGLEPEAVHYLKYAAEQNLGPMDEGSIEIIGQHQVIPDYRVPPIAHKDKGFADGSRAFMQSRMSFSPKVNEDYCTACETCVEQCPVQALTMVNDLPEVDKDACIICFCCQELCPEASITLS